MPDLDLEKIAALYFLHASTEVSEPDQVLQRHLDLAKRRQHGEVLLSVDREHRSIQIVTDDMPLLVESLTALLSRLKVGLAVIVHPVFAVTRDDDGVLTSIGSGPNESWIHLQLRSSTTDAQLDEAESFIGTVLDDVRRVHVDRVRSERRRGRVLDALVDRQDRDVAGARQTTVVVQAAEVAQNLRRAVATDEAAIDEIRPGQVDQVLRDAGAFVGQQGLGFVAEQRVEVHGIGLLEDGRSTPCRRYTERSPSSSSVPMAPANHLRWAARARLSSALPRWATTSSVRLWVTPPAR